MANISRKARSRRSDGDSSSPLSPQRDSSKLPVAFNLAQVEHGLNYPEFDPNAHFAPDLFTDSSPLVGTSKVDADAACASIEEKRQTLRIAQSNLALNQDVVSTGVAYQKFLGTVIDYGTAQVNNHAKFIGYQSARVNLETAQIKLSQAQERLAQEQAILNGMVELTPLIREEWEQKRALKQSRLADLKQSVFEASAKLDAEVRQLASAV